MMEYPELYEQSATAIFYLFVGDSVHVNIGEIDVTEAGKCQRVEPKI